MSVKKNTALNIAGSLVPIVVALFCVPILLRDYGAEGFSVLTLVILLIGYFSFFDFGLGKSLTYKISRADYSDREGISRIINGGLLINLLTGLFGAAIITIASLSCGFEWLKLSADIKSLVDDSFIVAAVGIVPVVMAGAVRGVMEGLNKFMPSNINKMYSGVATYIAPLVSYKFHGPDLLVATSYIVLVRYLIFVFGLWQIRDFISIKSGISRKDLSDLFVFGGWLTVTGILGPIMVYGDKFVVASYVGAAFLIYYTIPQDVVQRVLILPTAICNAFFPKYAKSSSKERVDIYKSSLILMIKLMGIIALTLSMVWQIFFELWISKEFSEQSYVIAIVLTMGVLFNSIAMVPYTLLHAHGKPKITAILHAIEFPLYFMILYFLISEFNLIGAAFAWTIRVLIDMLVLLFVAKKINKSYAHG